MATSQKYVYEERMIFSIYQHTYTLIRKGCPDRNMGKHMSRQFTQEEIHIANKYKKTFNFICN